MKHFTTPDGLSLAYDDRGEGVPLLCLAGLSRNMGDFETVLNFADRARIIRLDSRGRGSSDHARDPAEYNILQESQDAVALLDHLGLEKAAILGTSRGGLIAMTLAVTQPQRLMGVCFNDIGPVIDPAGLAFIMDYLGLPPKDADLQTALRDLPARYAPSFANISPGAWEAFIRRVWNVAEDGSLSLSYDPALRQAVAAQMQQAADAPAPAPDLWPMFDALSALPLGLIRGANSNLLSNDTAVQMRARRPDMLFAEIPDRGHVPFLDEPGAQALIADFLELL